MDEAVEKAARSFESMGGAGWKRFSIPWHLGTGFTSGEPSRWKGATMLMIAGNSMGTNWKGHYTTGLQDIFAHGWQSRADDLSETTKLVVLMGQYMQDRYHGHYYSKAQNLARMLTAAYDQALSEYDLLVMPHPADEGDGYPTRRLQPPGVHRPGAGNDPQHLSLRRKRPSGHLGSVRSIRWPAHRYDAGGTHGG